MCNSLRYSGIYQTTWMHLAIAIPTYNEKSNLTRLIYMIRQCTKDLIHTITIIVIDDNSPDGTADAVEQLSSNDLRIIVIRRPAKMGLGSAYKNAFEWIRKNREEITGVIQMDADLSHPPSLIVPMITELEQGAEVVIASRYLEKRGIENWPVYRRMISKGANLYVRMILGTRISDITSGYRAYSINSVSELLRNKLASHGYEYQVESAYILSRMNMKIKEIPFVFANRVEGNSKLGFKDILCFVFCAFKLRFRTFTPSEEEKAHNKARISE